jgi:hypothetical protein
MAKHFANGDAEAAAERARPAATHRAIGQPRVTLHPAGETTVPTVKTKPKKARRRRVQK